MTTDEELRDAITESNREYNAERERALLAAPVRFSNLSHMAESAAHYRAAVLRVFKDTPAMRLGRVVDAYFFGDDKIFQNGPVAVFEGERRGNKWTTFKEEHPHAEIVTSAENDTARRMVDSLRANAAAVRLLAGRHRVELSWTYCGRAVVSHPDVVGSDWITDLKTSFTSKPARFLAHARKMAYHAQLAFYGMAVEAAEGWKPVEFFNVVVESSEPFITTVFQLTPDAVEAGQKLCRMWIERMVACEQANVWPGYTEMIVEFDSDEDVELTFGEVEEEAGP